MNFRKIGCLVGISIFTFCSIVTHAAESQLRIFLGNDAPDVQLSIYNIAENRENGFELLPQFDGVDIEFDKLDTAQSSKEAAEAVYQWIVQQEIKEDQTCLTNEEGKANFSVDSGLYLLAKISDEGQMAPVLINVLEEFEGEYIDISPKYSPNQPDKPDEPDKPDKPDEPEQPDEPDKPDKPDEPEQPDKSDNSKKPDAPNTGDETNILLWCGVAGAALAGMIVVFLKIRKR